MLSDDDVKKVADLARIKLTDEEVGRFGKQLSAILDYMDILEGAPVEDLEGTNQVTGLENVMDKDEVLDDGPSREELLECSELPVDSNQIRVLPAIK